VKKVDVKKIRLIVTKYKSVAVLAPTLSTRFLLETLTSTN